MCAQVAAGEAVQLDHDYCSSLVEGQRGQVSFYNCNSNEYRSEPRVERREENEEEESRDKHWAEKNSKKDSGLESGEVSDASDDPPQSLEAIAATPPVRTRPFLINLDS